MVVIGHPDDVLEASTQIAAQFPDLVKIEIDPEVTNFATPFDVLNNYSLWDDVSALLMMDTPEGEG